MKQIHILYISAFSQWGGSTISLLRRIKNLNHNTFKITVAVPEDGPMVKKYEAAGALVKIVPISILLRFNNLKQVLEYVAGFIPSVLRLYRLIKRYKVDIVHSNDTIILVGGIAAKLAGVGSITHIRDDIKTPAWVIRFRNILINLFSDCILSVIRSVQDVFTDFGGDTSKTLILYNGVDLNKFRPGINGNDFRQAFSIPEQAKVVTHIARIDPNKGQDCVIRAATMVLKTVTDVYFLMVGDNNVEKFQWYKNKVLNLTSESGLQKQVIFTGRQDNIEKVINISDVIVLPSAYEAMPAVLCESAACSRPVVASRVGGIPEIVKDGKTGYLIPPQDAEALSDALIRLLSNPVAAKKMGLEGRVYMEEKYDLINLTKNLEIIYKNLIRSKYYNII